MPCLRMTFFTTIYVDHLDLISGLGRKCQLHHKYQVCIHVHVYVIFVQVHACIHVCV